MPRSRRQLAKIQESIQKERSVVLKAALSGNFKLFRRGIAEELDSLQEIPVGEVCLGEGLLEVRVTDDEANRLVRKAYAELLDATEGPLGSRTRRGQDPCISTFPVEYLAAWLAETLEVCDHLDGTPKYLHGGIHYLIGDGTDGHFWSLVINFLQTGNALPMSTTSVARGLVRKKTWVALNREWTAILLAARDDPNNVMCMWHHKPSGCCVNASGRCPFVHTSSPPLSLAELLRSPAPSSSKESPLVCSNCGAESAQDGGPLKRCSQCKNIDSMYCSRSCQKQAWSKHKQVCRSRVAESQRLREQGEARVFSDASGVGAVIMMDCPGQESRLVLSSGEGIASFTPILDLPFWSVEELPVELQFLLSCGFKPDIHRVKKLAPRLDVNEVRLPGSNFTGLEWASRKGHMEIVRWLCLEGGADASVGNPVLWAAYTNHVHVARMLVEFGADPQKQDPKYGMAAIHIAAENGSRDAVEWLVEEIGVDPMVRCRYGMTALQRAEAIGASDAVAGVVRYLRSKV